MKQITLEAWGDKSVELDPQEADALARMELVRVLIDEPPNTWRLLADSRIGVVWHEDWELRVSPRLAIPRLMFLLGYAADPRGWRDAVAPFGADQDLFSAIANGFAFHAKRAISPTPIRGYITVEDRDVTLRGRLRFADQIARWPGLPIPLELSYDDYTADIAENQMLRGATELLLRFPRVPVLARRRLLGIRAALQDVLAAAPSRDVKCPTITRLNSRYRAALALAELILRGSSITSAGGRVKSVSFVFDMNKVFEDFISSALRSSLERLGGQVRLQYGQERLDVQRRIRLIPDISWWRGSQCRAVVDAKYKRLHDDRFPNADAYQMLGYCTALGLSRGYLVYAKNAGEADRSHRIRNTDIDLEIKTVDVEDEPDVLLANVDRLAADIAAAARVP
jgi:5-methylcytosine-specific restriction enzyme subunit McrC